MSNQPNKKNNWWIWLVAMIVCFSSFELWPIALVILFWKVINIKKIADKNSTVHKTVDGLSKAGSDLRKAFSSIVGIFTDPTGKAATTAGNAAASANKSGNSAGKPGSSADKAAASAGKPGSSAGKTAASAASGAPTADTNSGKKIPGGIPLIAGGAALAALFSIGAVGFAVELAESLLSGLFLVSELVPLLVALIGLVFGLALLLAGVVKNRRRDRWLNYLGYIGVNRQVDLAPMAAAFGVSVRRLCEDLRKMLAEKVLPTGWLDLAAGKLILSETGYQAPPQTQPQSEPEPAPPQDDNAILAEIRAVNDAIPDPVMSEKIDRIEEITGKILDYQRRNPGKDSQLRSFLNYYLPTTLKILRSYAQLDAQGVEGENITAAKQRIEGMMDKVVEGFETQLDKLFADSAMDISSDVAVLEQMLKKDGLSSDPLTLKDSGQGMAL